jgi:hypothetical protein
MSLKKEVQNDWHKFLSANNQEELSMLNMLIEKTFTIPPDCFFRYLELQTGRKGEQLMEFLKTKSTQEVKERLKGRIPTVPALNTIMSTVVSSIHSNEVYYSQPEDILRVTLDVIDFAKTLGIKDLSALCMAIIVDDSFNLKLDLLVKKHPLCHGKQSN